MEQQQQGALISFTLTLSTATVPLLVAFSLIFPSLMLSDVLPAGAGEKTGTMLSDGAIYSSIDFAGKAGYSSPGRGNHASPYATTQILQSNSFHELAVDRPEPRWKASLRAQHEMPSLGYSLTENRSCANGIHKAPFSLSFSVLLCRRKLNESTLLIKANLLIFLQFEAVGTPGWV